LNGVVGGEFLGIFGIVGNFGILNFTGIPGILCLNLLSYRRSA